MSRPRGEVFDVNTRIVSYEELKAAGQCVLQQFMGKPHIQLQIQYFGRAWYRVVRFPLVKYLPVNL